MDTHLAHTDSRPHAGPTPLSLVVATLAAAAGALAWAGVSFFVGYEIGYLAWAIGALVGLGVVKAGGRGTVCAGTAAVLAVAGIAGGKLLGTRFLVEKEFQQVCAQSFTPALHRELQVDAADFVQLTEETGEPGHDELRQFLFDHGYTDAAAPEDIGDQDLQLFLAANAPELTALHTQRTSYEDWYAERLATSRAALEQNFSVVQANLEELTPIDGLFLILGVSTAFGMVRRASRPVVQPDGEQLAPDPDHASDEENFRRAA